MTPSTYAARSHLSSLSSRQDDLQDALQLHRNFVLPLSHDEVVHGKKRFLTDAGDARRSSANLRAYYGWLFAFPVKAAVYGQRSLPRGGWNHDASLDRHLLEGATTGITGCSVWCAI